MRFYPAACLPIKQCLVLYGMFRFVFCLPLLVCSDCDGQAFQTETFVYKKNKMQHCYQIDIILASLVVDAKNWLADSHWLSNTHTTEPRFHSIKKSVCVCVWQKARVWVTVSPLPKLSIWVGGTSRLMKRRPEITHLQLCRCSQWLYY